MLSQIKSLITDETGGETLDYALVIGLIVVGTLLVMPSLGTKILARWTSIERML